MAAVVGGHHHGHRREARPEVAFISWGAVGGRAIEIAGVLGGEARCFFAPGPEPRPSAPVRYVLSAIGTAAYLIRRRPRSLIITTPPIVAGLMALCWCRLARVPLVVDAHPGAFGAQGDRVSERLGWLHRRVVARAGLTLVAAPAWQRMVECWGGRALVFHEAPSGWEGARPPSRSAAGDRLKVLYVGRFARDEPIEAVIDAARCVPDCDVLVTGERSACPDSLRDALPPNVRFVGFLEAGAYRRAVLESDGVLALTTEESSVMRAACEAIFACRPLVCSDWPIARELFPYALHVRNDAEAIAAGLGRLARRYDEAAHSTIVARELQVRRFEGQAAALRAWLDMERSLLGQE
ncbi:MAG: glycosyltransferase [Acidimicrobiales bacterium]